MNLEHQYEIERELAHEVEYQRISLYGTHYNFLKKVEETKDKIIAGMGNKTPFEMHQLCLNLETITGKIHPFDMWTSEYWKLKIEQNNEKVSL